MTGGSEAVYAVLLAQQAQTDALSARVAEVEARAPRGQVLQSNTSPWPRGRVSR
jgi:hypothetical protein